MWTGGLPRICITSAQWGIEGKTHPFPGVANHVQCCWAVSKGAKLPFTLKALLSIAKLMLANVPRWRLICFQSATPGSTCFFNWSWHMFFTFPVFSVYLYDIALWSSEALLLQQLNWCCWSPNLLLWRLTSVNEYLFDICIYCAQLPLSNFINSISKK